jgi:hypothetical protein
MSAALILIHMYVGIATEWEQEWTYQSPSKVVKTVQYDKVTVLALWFSGSMWVISREINLSATERKPNVLVYLYRLVGKKQD